MKFLLFAAAVAAIWWLVKGMMRARPALSPEAAARLLGISVDADAPAIIDAHKKLIAKVHPDAGGTAELAAQVNQARDLLLSRITNRQA